MAQYNAKIAPFVNVTFYVTSVWWELPRNHRGLDIATPSPGNNLYSMCNGTLIHKGWDEDGYGNYIIMKDSETNMGFLYAHMREPSPLNVGDSVVIGQYVGHEGTTGDSTGVHLHLEMQDLTNHSWQYRASKDVYTNPTEFMGFPNTEGISVFYDGSYIPDIPDVPSDGTRKRKKFPWIIMIKKIRERRIFN